MPSGFFDKDYLNKHFATHLKLMDVIKASQEKGEVLDLTRLSHCDKLLSDMGHTSNMNIASRLSLGVHVTSFGPTVDDFLKHPVYEVSLRLCTAIMVKL